MLNEAQKSELKNKIKTLYRQNKDRLKNLIKYTIKVAYTTVIVIGIIHICQIIL